MPSCGVCLSRSYIFITSKDIYENFSPSGSPTILVFLYQTAWQYSDRNPPNGGLECRLGRQKSCTLVCILHLATDFLFTAGVGRPSTKRCTQSQLSMTVKHETDPERSRAIHIHDRQWIVCMTAGLDVTPKTTEQNRIVRSGKSEVEVTNNKKTAIEVLYYWSNHSNEASYCLIATAELLVGITITQTVGHQKVVSFFHLTYFVQLSCLGKLLCPENHEFSLKLPIFTWTVTTFIADAQVVYLSVIINPILKCHRKAHFDKNSVC